MEFSEAITLDQWMSTQTLDPVSKVTVFKNTLNILANLHESKIAHGCLNPSNIYVSSDKSVKIGGFGA
jgi:serine/threonine protein kinase